MLAALLLAAAPLISAPPFVARGLEADQAARLHQHFVQELERAGVSISPGASVAVAGELSFADGEWMVKLEAAEASGAVVGSWLARERDEAAVLQFLTSSAQSLAAKVKPSRRGSLISGIAAGVFVVTGAVLMAFARADEAAIRNGSGITTYADLLRIRGRGEDLQFAGVVFLSAAGAAAVAALILFGFQRTDVRPTVAVVPGGAMGGLTFTLP